MRGQNGRPSSTSTIRFMTRDPAAPRPPPVPRTRPVGDLGENLGGAVGVVGAHLQQDREDGRGRQQRAEPAALDETGQAVGLETAAGELRRDRVDVAPDRHQIVRVVARRALAGHGFFSESSPLAIASSQGTA